MHVGTLHCLLRVGLKSLSTFICHVSDTRIPSCFTSTTDAFIMTHLHTEVAPLRDKHCHMSAAKQVILRHPLLKQHMTVRNIMPQLAPRSLSKHMQHVEHIVALNKMIFLTSNNRSFTIKFTCLCKPAGIHLTVGQRSCHPLRCDFRRGHSTAHTGVLHHSQTAHLDQLLLRFLHAYQKAHVWQCLSHSSSKWLQGSIWGCKGRTKAHVQYW